MPSLLCPSPAVLSGKLSSCLSFQRAVLTLPSRPTAQVTSSLTAVSDFATPNRSAQSSVICGLTVSKFTANLLFTRYVLDAGNREDNVINQRTQVTRLISAWFTLRCFRFVCVSVSEINHELSESKYCYCIHFFIPGAKNITCTQQLTKKCLLKQNEELNSVSV